jgi:death on curing protein
MIRYLTRDEVVDLHRWALQAYGGADGLRDEGLLESAIHAPQGSFGGIEFYPNVYEKAAALGYSLTKNHAFVDGNKRVGFASMATFLRLNGYEIRCQEDEGVDIMLRLAAGSCGREELVQWLESHCQASQSQADGQDSNSVT